MLAAFLAGCSGRARRRRTLRNGIFRATVPAGAGRAYTLRATVAGKPSVFPMMGVLVDAGQTRTGVASIPATFAPGGYRMVRDGTTAAFEVTSPCHPNGQERTPGTGARRRVGVACAHGGEERYPRGPLGTETPRTVARVRPRGDQDVQPALRAGADGRLQRGVPQGRDPGAARRRLR